MTNYPDAATHCCPPPIKKKKDRSGHWRWPRSIPTARGREIWPPLMAIFVSDKPKKKKKKRKKKKIGPLGVAVIHPNSQRERDLATPNGFFFSLASQKKKKKNR
jgi:hypothetical protein